MQASTIPVVSVLTVGAPDVDHEKLEKIFCARGWRLGRAGTRREARDFIDTTSVGVVISESELPEGGWREVLADLTARPEPPLLIVTARLADESLWAEVLNMGGYDVLAKPLDSEEVERVISAAVRRQDNERQRIAAQPALRFRLAVAS